MTVTEPRRTLDDFTDIPSVGELPSDEEPASLYDVEATYQRWQHFPDPIPLYVVLAAILANRMDEGDPVWLMILGGSSRGKTELLGALAGIPFIRVVGGLTEASLLSGTPKRERKKSASGGLLKELPEQGSIIVVKDFGAIIAMPRDRRATVLQALRDVYDGRYTRDVGTGGGERLEWTGRLGFIGAATGSLDAHHSVITALGERWLTLRIHSLGARESARASLQHHHTGRMRAELANVVRRYLAHQPPPPLRAPGESDTEFLSSLSMLAANARSPVERDTYSREIILVPQTEGPARLARQFHKMMTCLQHMGLDHRAVRDALLRIALDTIPSPRREALDQLLSNNGARAITSELAEQLELPVTTATRTLEELHVLGLSRREKTGPAQTAPWCWWASDEARGLWVEVQKPPDQAVLASPEVSHTPIYREEENIERDKTGEAPFSSNQAPAKGPREPEF